jgi:hypothetical protein
MNTDERALPGPSGTYLTIPEAHQLIIALGFKDTKRRQVVRWATEKRLPFFRWGKKLYIAKNELEMSFKRIQYEATKHVRRL